MCKENSTKAGISIGKVTSLKEVKPGIYHLVLKTNLVHQDFSVPQSGQFYMLRSSTSKVLLSRPISVFSSKTEGDFVFVEFLILLKGQGTKELCNLSIGDSVDMTGPLGNTFPKPQEDFVSTENPKIAIVGGGIGVAPVAGFSKNLVPQSYDFYACFKSYSYGLENVKAKNLTITTDDGSEGVKGMLPTVLTAEILLQKKYSVVYACGPEPMLKYVQKICAEAGILCYLSMEQRMACGVGACLGCTITTTEGNKRCCKDGPVFEGSKLIFAEKPFSPRKEKQDKKPDLSVTIAGVKFENPVIAASGTFGFGTEFNEVIDVNLLGGISSKGLTLDPKPGNTGIRLQETPSGLINSIGLENPGIRTFIEKKLPVMMNLKPVAIANLSGSSIETYVEGAKLLDKTEIPMIELNISCPNVKAGGMAFGLDPEAAFEVTNAVRKATSKPLIVKLSPNAPDLKSIAFAVIKAGADAISLVNTFQAMAIDVEKEQFIFDNIKAGLAGPAIKPIALRMVFDICSAIKTLPEEEQVPIIGLGGISTWQDAVEFILAGADAIQVGTSIFANPNCLKEIIEGLYNWMERKGYSSISEFKGKMLQ